MCHRQFKTPFCIFCMFSFCPFRFRLFEFYDIRFKIFHNISGIVCDRNCFRYFVIYNYISSTSSFSLIFPNGSYWSQGIVPHLNENFTSSKVGFFFIFTRFFRYSFNSFLFFRWILALNFFILPPLKKRITGFASNTLRFVGWFATE